MSAAPSRRARWPDAAWDVALLRSLDARARTELESAGRLRDVRDGEAVFRVGEPADAVLVVVAGVVVVRAIPRGETTSRPVRRAGRGELVGEEAMVLAHGARPMDANAEGAVTVAELPVTVLRRALVRGGVSDLAARVERGLRRAAARDVLAGSALGHLSGAHLDLLLDAVQHEELARGQALFRAGDAVRHVHVVGAGLLQLQLQTDDASRPRIEAYVGRGDILGDDDAERRTRAVSAVAAGPAWVLSVPVEAFGAVARATADARARTRRLRVVDDHGRPAGATAHVLQDLYRLRVARSLLVIDQDACIRCGHCAWSCADAHEDGIARLVRRGDKVVVSTDDGARPLLVPNSCQHCQHPACMVDCPTGAIGRDARGEVFVRADLCTGCGACAKGCPWDNIQMASRPGPAPDVAVKCDLCSSRSGGPACVAACPTEAIARIDPNQALSELRDAPALAALSAAVTRLGGASTTDASLPRRPPVWPVVVGGALAGVGLAAFDLSPRASGVLVGLAFAITAATAIAKRAPRLVARLPRLLRAARALYVLHVAAGASAVGGTLAHAGSRLPRDVAGALTLAFAIALASGAALAAAHALLPRRLTRLERAVRLPEDLAGHLAILDERLFGQLTGRSEVVKTLYARVLAPYVRARLGALSLVASGRSVREEEAHLRARVGTLLAGRSSERLGGLDELVRIAVEHRATRAQRLLGGALRGFVAPHVVASVVAAVLLVVHVLHVSGALRGAGGAP